MNTTFLDQYSNNTKVWVYQSPRPFSFDEQQWLHATGAQFLNSWNAHGAPIKATIQILNDRFLVIASDQEHTANSGCSIDSMVRFVRQVQDQTQLDLMNRMLVYYEKDGELVPCHFQQIGELYKQGEISADTPVFNPLVDSKPSFEENFKKPLAASWLARFV